MTNYLVDLHRLRHNPYNGLYTFSSQLAAHLPRHLLEEEQLHYYLPKDKFGLVGNKARYVTHKRWHKFYQPGTNKYAVWHLTTGISQYRPFNKHTKVITTIHDVNFLIEEPDHLKKIARVTKRMQANIDRSDHIAGISRHALLFAAQHLDFRNKPTSVIYNGYAVMEPAEVHDLPYKPRKPFLFSISLVQPRKNFHVLPSLLEGNDYELVIAGLNHFEYAKEVIAAARKWGVADRVKLIGAVNEADKSWYLANCTAFMFPSIAEGFGIPPLEAMHFGKPVFLSRCMSLPEVGGKVAYYFDNFEPADMKQVFENGMNDWEQNKRQQVIKEHAATFSWDSNAREYLALYRSCLK